MTKKYKSRRSRWSGTRRNSMRVTGGLGPNSRLRRKATGQRSWVEIKVLALYQAPAHPAWIHLTHQPCKRASRKVRYPTELRAMKMQSAATERRAEESIWIFQIG